MRKIAVLIPALSLLALTGCGEKLTSLLAWRRRLPRLLRSATRKNCKD